MGCQKESSLEFHPCVVVDFTSSIKFVVKILTLLSVGYQSLSPSKKERKRRNLYKMIP